MEFVFKDNISEKEFNDFTYNHTLGTFFQTSNWASVKSEWKPIYTGVYLKDELVACALVLKRKIFLGYSFMYVPRGPILNVEDEVLLTFFLKQLKQLTKDHKALSMMIDPYVSRATYDMNQAMKGKVEYHYNDELLGVFESSGYIHSEYGKDLKDTLQPRFQPVVYIDEEDKAKKSRAYKAGVRALNNNVTIHRGNVDNVKEFTDVISKTADYKSISLRGSKYFNKLATIFKEDCLITLSKLDLNVELQSLKDRHKDLLERLENPTIKEGRRNEYNSQVAKLEKDIDFTNQELAKGQSVITLAGLLVLKNGTKAELLYAGMDRDYLRYAGSNVNYIDALNWAKENGCKKLYFGGSSGHFDEGIDKFKASFNPYVEEFVGEFEFVNKKMMNKLFQIGLTLRAKLLKFKNKM